MTLTVSTGSFILLLCSVVTGLIVEAIKKMVGGEVRNINLLVGVVSLIVGVIVPILYMVVHHIPFNSDCVLYIAGIVGLSWLCAMLGYDKVIQTLMQVKR